MNFAIDFNLCRTIQRFASNSSNCFSPINFFSFCNCRIELASSFKLEQNKYTVIYCDKLFIPKCEWAERIFLIYFAHRQFNLYILICVAYRNDKIEEANSGKIHWHFCIHSCEFETMKSLRWFCKDNAIVNSSCNQHYKVQNTIKLRKRQYWTVQKMTESNMFINCG